MLEQLKSYGVWLVYYSRDILTLSVAVVLSGSALIALLVVLKRRDAVSIDVFGHQVLVVRRGVDTRHVQQAKDATLRAAASGTPKTDSRT